MGDNRATGGFAQERGKGFWSFLTRDYLPSPPTVILGKDKKQALITKHLGS